MKSDTSQKQKPSSPLPQGHSKTNQRRAGPSPARNTVSTEINLPLAEGAECEVLGIIIMDGVGMLQRAVEAGLAVNLFQIPSNKTIFTALTDIQSRGWDICPVTLQDYLNSQHQLEKIGGPAYIAKLLSGRAIGPSTIPGLIRQLADIDYKRQAAKKAEALLRLAGNGASPAEIEEFLDSIPRIHAIKQSYFLTPAGIFWRKPPRFGSFGFESEQVTNFCAKIISEVIADDGSSEEQRIFELEITVRGETRRIEVPATKFDSMAWVTAQLGAEGGVCPGKADHARYAIKQLSPSFSKRIVYAHTGWRKIGDAWCYLHGAGAITADGNRTDIAVRLPHSLRFFVLPEPKKEAEGTEAYKSILSFLDAFPRPLTVPLLGAVFAAAMGEIDYSVYVVGQSGVFKSEITALVNSFFGAGINRLTMPANWDDTANVLLSKLFTAKDGVLVIDDFTPNGNKKHDDELHAKAERVFRAAGNRTGRGRLQSDMTERLAKEPRAMLISSGEDLPRGMSLQARLLIVPIEKDMVTSAALTEMQQAAAQGKLAASLATFLSYLARDREKIKAQFDKDRIAYRDKLNQNHHGHARQTTTTAHLAASWRVWLKSATEEKAIDREKGNTLWRQIWRALAEAGHDQQSHQASLNPADHFVDLLRSALISGKANLQTVDGGLPKEIGNLCGWRDGKPNGECVGWVHDNILYLEMNTAYGVANAQGHRNGEGIAVGKKMLTSRLEERGLILGKQQGRGRKTRTPGNRMPAIAMPLNVIFPPHEGEGN